MSSTAATPAAPPPDMIGAMTACAFALGTAAAEMAKGAGDDTDLFLAASAEFRHCFFAVRMGMRLKMALGAGVTPGAARVLAGLAGSPEAPERPETEGPETERLDHLETERERDRDYEPVSLPQFLKTLGVAATRAEARREALPADVRDHTLPRLRGLLNQADCPSRLGPSPSGAAAAPRVRPSAAPASRSRWLASSGAGGLLPTPPPTARRRDSS